VLLVRRVILVLLSMGVRVLVVNIGIIRAGIVRAVHRRRGEVVFRHPGDLARVFELRHKLLTLACGR